MTGCDGDCDAGDLNIRDVRAGDSTPIRRRGAILRWAGGLREYRNGVGKSPVNERSERKGPVCVHGQTVGAVVLQDKPRAGEPRDRAADGVGGDGCGAGDLNIRDVRAGGPTSIRHLAGLRRAGGLRLNRNRRSAAASNGSSENEGSICADREAVSAVVLQDKPRAGESRDRAADGVGGWGGGWATTPHKSEQRDYR